MKKLQDTVVLVTGAASAKGIGRAIALAMAREGAHIACADINKNGCLQTARLVRKEKAQAIALRADAAKADEVQKAVDSTVAAFGGLDVLINNAGIACFKNLIDLSEEDWDRTFQINSKGYFLFCRAAAKAMIKQGRGGVIINISSISATLAGAMKVHYCASKAAVHMMTQGLALELASAGIRVNEISPGSIETNIIKNAGIREALARIPRVKRTPLGRPGTAADIAPAAVFLASDDASFITGANLVIDGGLTAGQPAPQPLES